MAKVIPIDKQHKFRMPDSSDRIAIIGHTGSGKSQNALWHLSHANFDVQPWVIIDPKEDEKINGIEGLQHINVGYIPEQPGIYAVHPTQYEVDALDDYFVQLLQHRRVGVYADEGYLCGFGPGFTTFLIQGRSKHCPAIILNQRPVDISRFAFSEAQFFQCFPLTDNRDYKTLRGFAKVPSFDEAPLPPFYSYYYDVRWRKSYVMRPVPRINVILDTIADRLEALQPKRRGVRYI